MKSVSVGAQSGTFTRSFSLNPIEEGSTLTSAFLLVGRVGSAPEFNFLLNQYSIAVEQNSFTGTEFNVEGYGGHSGMHYIDIADYLTSNNLNVFEIEETQTLSANKYTDFIFFAVFENESLPETCMSIYLNEQEIEVQNDFNLDNFLPFDILHDIGLSFMTTYLCDTIQDGEHLQINNEYIGILGGQDESAGLCGGPIGCFRYRNGTLLGECDDVANSTISGSDALLKINNYITNNSNEIVVSTNYQSPNWEVGIGTNVFWGFCAVYRSTCQPFETTVTDKVENHCGDTVQLEATGGIAYEWLPQQNLSCYDCPNPIYEGDSSTFYTVRIWNTDSCSKVLPVKINIYEPLQSVNLTTTPANCGENDGALAIGTVNGGQGAYLYRFDENWISNPTSYVFSQLAAGDYTLSVKDQNNCLLHQPFTIGEVNPAEAAFTASPPSGYAPLEVDFINQSNGSTDYEWLLADSLIYSFDFSYTFDSAGSYPVQLVSWYNLPHCADTAATTVLVYPQPPDYSHTLYFPTDYNPQHGPYSVETTNIQRIEWQVYNAVGQHIYSTNVETPNGSTALWDGGRHARGYYFFRVRYWDVEGAVYSGRGKVLLMR